MVENTDTALTKTCKEFNCEITDYTVAPIFMNEKQKERTNGLLNLKLNLIIRKLQKSIR